MLYPVEVVQDAGDVYHRATSIDVEVVIACACAMRLFLIVHRSNVCGCCRLMTAWEVCEALRLVSLGITMP